MVDIDAIKRRFERLLPTVDERMRRLIAAAESLTIDCGGISIVSRGGDNSVAVYDPRLETSVRGAASTRCCNQSIRYAKATGTPRGIVWEKSMKPGDVLADRTIRPLCEG